MKTKIFITACLVMILAMALVIPFATVSADYNEDVLDNPEVILNFNQLFDYNTATINSNYGYKSDSIGYWHLWSQSSTVFANLGVSFTFVSTHKYYVYFNKSESTNVTVLFGNHYIGAPTIIDNSSQSDNIYFRMEDSMGVDVVFYYIDLSACFGFGNEPNLQECLDLFVSDFYPYNTGSPVSLSAFNAYEQGVSDTLNSMDVTINNYLIGSNAFSFNNDTIRDSDVYYDSQYNAYLFEGVIGVPLFETLSIGTNLTIDFNLYNVQGGENQSYYMIPLNFGYVDSNNNLITIASIPVTNFVSRTDITYQGVVVLPVNTDTLYIWLSYDLVSDPNSDVTDKYIVSRSNITFRSLNVSSLITSAYASGYQQVIDDYSVGSDKYERIYNLGYTNGLNDTNPYTFARLMGAVVDAPLQAVLSVFNFEFLGYNLKNLITLLLTVCLVVAIIRLFIGGGD